jgi:2,4-dihydroxyhept-2-ene-1,7-dioic acid aldolase
MNLAERQLIDILKTLREEYGCEGVKAEFEAEGTRTEELMRLKEIALCAGVSLTLKIGGCEAIRDMHDARNVGVDHMVGPMVESAFALRKYVESAESVFSRDELDELEILVNVETISTIHHIDELFSEPAFSRLDGIVIGRGDLVESLGLPRSAADSEESFNHVQAVVRRAKEMGKTTVIGGNITAASLDYIRRLPSELLDRFETRKICFSTIEALSHDTACGIATALDFELLWLENKRNHYNAISAEDAARIQNLQQRKVK